jgi:hypothetical protein
MFDRARQLIRRYSWFVLFFTLSTTVQITRSPLLFAADGIASGIENSADQSGDVYEQGVPWRGAPGITETVEEIMAREEQRSSAANSAVFVPRPRKPLLKAPPKLEEDASAPEVSQWPATNNALRARPSPGPRNPQTIGTSFLAVDSTEPGCNCVPPDSMGAVGPTQVLVATNNRIKVFDKAGNLGALDTDTDSFFASVGGLVNGTADPHVRYDRLSGRWFVTIIDLQNVNDILIAVSSGSTITNLSSFTFFSFQHDQVGPTPNVDTGLFADYDTLGVDKFALYVGVNVFGVSFTGTTGFVINKADLLTGILTVTAFRHLAGNTCPSTGLFTPQGVHNDDPNATKGYFIGVDICTFNKLVLRRIGNPGGSPSISGNLVLNVPTTTFPIDQVQPSPGPALDGIDDRLFAASIHTNAITGAKTLWTAHNIQVNSAGVGSNSGGRNGSRWYQIGNLSGTPNLKQSGTLFDSAVSTPFGYWIPSVAMSGQGHMAIASSRAGAHASNGFAGIAAAGRLRTDALGTTQAPTLAQGSTFSYDSFVGGTERWGDYSQVSVDPNDNMTMWTFQEYASATDVWGVRAIKLGALPPATPASSTPPAVEVGQASVDVTIDGTSISGSEFFDPGPDTGGPGFANRLGASVTGGVVVNSVTFVNPTRVMLNLDTTAASQGAQDVTITNPDGQSLTGVELLTVSPDVPPMTLSTSPLPNAEVDVAYSEPLVTGGLPPYTITKTRGNYPAGLTPNTANGMLEGTPTVPALLGKYFTVRITDQLGASLKRRFKIVVKKAIIITTTSLPTGTSGQSYSKTLAASGGKKPRTWSEESGNLPAELSLDPATGVISGTPPSPSGPTTLTFKVVDVLGGEDQKDLTLTIN